MRIDRVCEVGIAVRDLEATSKLYTEVLGATPTEVMPIDQYGNRSQICRIGTTDFRLIEATWDNEVAQIVAKWRHDWLHHVGLQVSDIDEAIDWMKQNNIRMIDEAPRSENGVRFAYIHPEGFNGVKYKLIEGSHDLRYLPEPPNLRDIPGRVKIERVIEVAVNVKDLDSAIERMVTVFGTKSGGVGQVDMYGLRVNMNRLGDIDFELMAPVTKEGLIADSIAKIGEGFAHFGLLVTDVDAQIAWMKRNNVRLIDETPRHLPNLRFIFVHPAGFNGIMMELIERSSSWVDHIPS